MMTRVRWSAPAAVAFIVGVIIALDQLSKEIIVRQIGPDTQRTSIDILPGVFQFRFVRNTGSAFGLFQGRSEMIAILAMGAIAFLAIYYMRRARHDALLAVAIGLQIGGATGNLIDRFRYGYVVDFLDFPRFPTFNIADSAITVGVVLLMYVLLFRDIDRSEVRSDRPAQSTGEES
jgi:signal peptidase II